MKDVYKEISKFTIIGLSAVTIDFTIYYLVSSVLPYSLSKALGFIAGSGYTYYLNKKWTWRHSEKTNRKLLTRFYILYGISLIINVLVNDVVLRILPDIEILTHIRWSNNAVKPLFAIKGDKIIAFVMATGASAVFNFIGQKKWVFKK